MGDNQGVVGWVAELLKYGPLGAVLVASYFRLWMWRIDNVEALKAQAEMYERILALQTKRIDESVIELAAARGKRGQP